MKRMLLGATAVLATAAAFAVPSTASAQDVDPQFQITVPCTTPVFPCVQYYVGAVGNIAENGIGSACYILFGRQCDLTP